MEIFKLENAKKAKEKFQLPDLTQMVEQLKEFEVQIRACYGGNLAVGSEALAWRILIDGLFLLRLLGIISPDDKEKEEKGKNSELPYEVELPVFNEQQLYLNLEGNITTTQNEIVKDLLKLENQIPIQILKRVLPRNLVENLHLSFYKFCVSVSPLPLFPGSDEEDDIPFDLFPDYRRSFPKLPEILDGSQHLVHFLYALLFYQRFSAYEQRGSERSLNILVELLNLMATILGIGLLKQLVEALGLIQTLIGFIGKVQQSSPSETDGSPRFPSASKLKKVGVKFDAGDGGGFDEESTTLKLPTITMNAFSEVILRNLVAFEVEAKLNPPCLSDYVKLMSGLIATAKDVTILKRAGIIAGGRSGDEDDVVKMFKELGNVVNVSSDDGESRANFKWYMNFEVDIIEKIKVYYESRWVVKAERFGKRYIVPVFQALLILVAVVLILIVAVRTVCGWFSCPKIMGHSIINSGYYFL